MKKMILTIILFLTFQINTVYADKNFQQLLKNAKEKNASVEDYKKLANAYLNENNVEKDDEHAFYWFYKAAEKGDAIAQYQIATMYNSGEGTEKDLDEAYKWAELSANQDHKYAKYLLYAIEIIK